MKLSEKLAALEDDDVSETPAAPTPSAKAPRATKAQATHTSWEASKRKVRDLVLADLAPRMAGIDGDALRNEVKSAVDKFLTREDVKVSPAERRRFVDEVM